MSPRDVHIIGLGARTSLGATPLSAAGAVRAGITRQRERERWTDSAGEPVTLSVVPYLPLELELPQRIFELALDAAADALLSLSGGRAPASPIPVILGLPAPGPGRPEALARDLAASFPAQIGDLPELGRVEPIASGGAAGLMALERAWSRIRQGEVELCLAGGVDSYVDHAVLGDLDRRGRLLTERAPFGFCPGEGAGVCLLASDEALRGSETPSLGRLASVATRYEESVAGGGVCIGRGVTEAWRAALEALPEGARVSRIICDLNGERGRADELGFALTRASDRLEASAAAAFETPAECWGELGAASGPLLVTLGLAEGLRGRAEGRPWTLVSVGSDGGERSAALLEAKEAGS